MTQLQLLWKAVKHCMSTTSNNNYSCNLIFCYVVRTLNNLNITSEKEIITPLSELGNNEQKPNRMAEMVWYSFYPWWECGAHPFHEQDGGLWPAGPDLEGENSQQFSPVSLWITCIHSSRALSSDHCTKPDFSFSPPWKVQSGFT